MLLPAETLMRFGLNDEVLITTVMFLKDGMIAGTEPSLAYCLIFKSNSGGTGPFTFCVGKSIVLLRIGLVGSDGKGSRKVTDSVVFE
ncbi:Uncharacterised protein [uncultured archaeon]|nr:Uncharacterised protein [uncultured archaeon]